MEVFPESRERFFLSPRDMEIEAKLVVIWLLQGHGGNKLMDVVVKTTTSNKKGLRNISISGFSFIAKIYTSTLAHSAGASLWRLQIFQLWTIIIVSSSEDEASLICQANRAIWCGRFRVVVPVKWGSDMESSPPPPPPNSQ